MTRTVRIFALKPALIARPGVTATPRRPPTRAKINLKVGWVAGLLFLHFLLGVAYGVAPIASAVGNIPEYLADFSTGSAINSRDSRLFSDAVESYLHVLSRWDEHSGHAVKAAQRFSYGNYLQAVHVLLKLPVAVEQPTA
jgi:hypothetical protein